MFPDWTKAQYISNPTSLVTAPKNGFVYIFVYTGGSYSRDEYLVINGTSWEVAGMAGGYAMGTGESFLTPVKEGDHFYLSGNGETYSMYFIPCRT
jgi:hypothetical protein